MIVQYCDGKVPAPAQYTAVDQELIDLIANVLPQIELELGQFALHKAIALLWSVIEATNKYVVITEPWGIARQLRGQPDDGNLQQRFATTLFVLAEALHLIAELLRPFVPSTASTILKQLGLPETGAWSGSLGWSKRLVGVQVTRDGILFPKLTS